MFRIPRLAGYLMTLVAIPFSGAAQGQTESNDPSPVVVMIASMEAEQEALPIVRAVQGQLSDLDVHLKLISVDALEADLKSQIDYATQVTGAYDALAAFWCDFSSEENGMLLLADSSGKRVLVRKLSSTDEGGYAEELALIVRSTVVELESGGEIGVAKGKLLGEEERRELPTPPPKEPTEPEKDRPEGALKGAVAYALHMYSGDQLAVHGLDLDLSFAPPGLISFNVGYTFTGPIRARGSLLSMRLERHPAHLGVSARFVFGRFSLSPGLRLVFDYATVSDLDLSPELEESDGGGGFTLSVLPGIGAGIRMNDILSLFVFAGAEIALTTKHYVLGGLNGEEEVLNSWPVMPWFLVGFSVSLA